MRSDSERLNDPEWWFDDGNLNDPNEKPCQFVEDFVKEVKEENEKTRS